MKKFLFVISLFSITFISAQDLYLQCGSIVDTDTGKISKEKTIVVSGNKIKSVVSGFVKGSGDDKTIDLKSKMILPGLIDMHVHMESEFNPQAYIKRFTLNDADVAFESALNAKKTLMAGFTTVRDLGGSGVNISLKNAINRGHIPGPRIFTSGKAIGTTGGHADPTNGMRKELMGNPGPKEGVINSPEDAKKAVRQRYKEWG